MTKPRDAQSPPDREAEHIEWLRAHEEPGSRFSQIADLLGEVASLRQQNAELRAALGAPWHLND